MNSLPSSEIRVPIWHSSIQRFELIGSVSGLQRHQHFPQKIKSEWGETGLFSKGTAQIHFISGIGVI
jgi:hypothetical protein